MRKIEGGITTPQGFGANGVHCGIKRGKKAWKSGGFAQTRPKQKR